MSSSVMATVWWSENPAWSTLMPAVTMSESSFVDIMLCSRPWLTVPLLRYWLTVFLLVPFRLISRRENMGSPAQLHT